MAAVIKLPTTGRNGDDKGSTFGELKLDAFTRGLRTVRRDDLHVMRLRWHDPFLERIERTEGSDRSVEFNDSTTTRRFLQMAKARLPRRLQIRTISNPYTSTVAVWVQRRPGS